MASIIIMASIMTWAFVTLTLSVVCSAPLGSGLVQLLHPAAHALLVCTWQMQLAELRQDRAALVLLASIWPMQVELQRLDLAQA